MSDDTGYYEDYEEDYEDWEHAHVTCPRCKEVGYAGDFFYTRNMCCFCVSKVKEEDDALITLLKHVIRTTALESD